MFLFYILFISVSCICPFMIDRKKLICSLSSVADSSHMTHEWCLCCLISDAPLLALLVQSFSWSLFLYGRADILACVMHGVRRFMGLWRQKVVVNVWCLSVEIEAGESDAPSWTVNCQRFAFLEVLLNVQLVFLLSFQSCITHSASFTLNISSHSVFLF